MGLVALDAAHADVLSFFADILNSIQTILKKIDWNDPLLDRNLPLESWSYSHILEEIIRILIGILENNFDTAVE